MDIEPGRGETDLQAGEKKGDLWTLRTSSVLVAQTTLISTTEFTPFEMRDVHSFPERSGFGTTSYTQYIQQTEKGMKPTEPMTMTLASSPLPPSFATSPPLSLCRCALLPSWS